MNKLFLILCAAVVLPGFHRAQAQELQCIVKVQAPEIQITDKSVFNNLEERLQDFLNGREWTREKYEPEELIECSFVFNISEYDQNSGRFSGQLQISYSRPVFNSTYSSPVLKWMDRDVAFEYMEGAPIDFVDNQHINNLSSILAFYAYIIIGLDHDTYELGSGELYYVKAQNIAAAAQNDGRASGWRSFDSNRNRYWMVDNLLNPAFSPMINTLYTYHRLGMDNMYDQSRQEAAKLQIKNSLMALKDIHQRRPGSFLVQLFMEAKNDEIVSIFSGGPKMETQDLVDVLVLIDGTRSPKYEEIQSGN